MSDAPKPLADFAHRKNRDGSVDSICLYCFQTIASANIEEDLTVPESQHACHRKKRPASAPDAGHGEKFGRG
jgi:hypothetical protein